MYVPKFHEESDPAVLQALIRAYPLGTWVSHSDDGLLANHVPFLLDAGRGEHGTLLCHVARANPVWRSCAAGGDALVVFHGPDRYISPSWYPGKAEHGKAVPTWNYAVVHVHGRPRVVEDREWLLRHLARLTDEHEAGRELPWTLADAPADFTERLLAAIVGIEIPITRMMGKWKVSQNRTEADKRGVVAGLAAQGDSVSLDMAALVGRHLDGTPAA
ncbi:FMN-binding negative transcriptional regulator [Aquabacterium sp. A7-Y]|uniref:FMN-binding negative transcriptional regulator n=1 Tax=Aquabacterium sp. A7-Y TaxID=1349605 RepID=UPI00223E70F4|nr:FMN-binding negative transcriptional regulator [Aquabacterium sp. A7-Y]MCW7541724.1 FMN-binding negative transcriptional regulator [Aquabacterium sp. A7-Y]